MLRRKLWDSMYYLLSHPVQTLSGDSIRILWHYYSIATANIGRRDAEYQREVANHLVRSLIYEILLWVEDIARMKPRNPDRSTSSKMTSCTGVFSCCYYQLTAGCVRCHNLPRSYM